MYFLIPWERSEWGGKIETGMAGRGSDMLSGLINVLIGADASVVNEPEEGDRNRNCGESGDQGADKCNEGM